jgi:hypothetical protein
MLQWVRPALRACAASKAAQGFSVQLCIQGLGDSACSSTAVTILVLLLCFDWLQHTEASVITRDSHWAACIWYWCKKGIHCFLCSSSHGLRQSLFNSLAAGW